MFLQNSIVAQMNGMIPIMNTMSVVVGLSCSIIIGAAAVSSVICCVVDRVVVSSSSCCVDWS